MSLLSTSFVANLLMKTTLNIDVFLFELSLGNEYEFINNTS